MSVCSVAEMRKAQRSLVLVVPCSSSSREPDSPVVGRGRIRPAWRAGRARLPACPSRISHRSQSRLSRQPRTRASPVRRRSPLRAGCSFSGLTREHRGSAGRQVDHPYLGRGSCVCDAKTERETKRSHCPRQGDRFVSRCGFSAQGFLTIRCEVRGPLLRPQSGAEPNSTTPTTRL